MGLKRFYRLFGRKSAEDLIRATDLDAVIAWCRGCHADYEANHAILPGRYSVSFPAWWAVPAFLALKKIGYPPDVPSEILDPIAAALSADATEDLTGLPSDDPEMADIAAAMKQNMSPHIRQWLAAFDKIKRSYFRDRTLTEAMLKALMRQPDAGLADSFGLTDDEDIDDFATAFGGFLHFCSRRLPRFGH